MLEHLGRSGDQEKIFQIFKNLIPNSRLCGKLWYFLSNVLVVLGMILWLRSVANTSTFGAICSDSGLIKASGIHHKAATTLPWHILNTPELNMNWNLWDSWLIHTLSSWCLDCLIPLSRHINHECCWFTQNGNFIGTLTVMKWNSRGFSIVRVKQFEILAKWKFKTSIYETMTCHHRNVKEYIYR